MHQQQQPPKDPNAAVAMDGIQDVDALFRTYNISEVTAIEKSVRHNIEQKKEDLRQMVGRRYRDILEAADNIRQMNADSAQILERTQAIGECLKRLSQLHADFAATERSSRSVGQQPAVNQELNTLQSVKESQVHHIIKLYIELPELVWDCLDRVDDGSASETERAERLLSAVWLIRVGTQIQQDIEFIGSNLVNQKYAAVITTTKRTLQQLRDKLRAKLDNHLSAAVPSDASAASLAQTFVAATLLGQHHQSSTESQSHVDRLLAAKMPCLSAILSDVDQSTRQQLAACFAQLQCCIGQMYVLFRQPAAEQLLSDIQHARWMPAVYEEQLALSTNLPTSVHRYLRSFSLTASLPFQRLDADEFRAAVDLAMQRFGRTIQDALDEQIEYFDTIGSLATLKSSVQEAVLETIFTPPLEWSAVCSSAFGGGAETDENAVDPKIDLWKTMAEEICDRKIGEIAAEHVKTSVAEYFAAVTDVDNQSTPSTAAKTDLAVQNECRRLDEGIEYLCDGIKKYSGGQTTTPNPHLMNSLANACQHSISRYISDTDALINDETSAQMDAQLWRLHWLSIRGVLAGCPVLRACMSGTDVWTPTVAMLHDTATTVCRQWLHAIAGELDCGWSRMGDMQTQLYDAQQPVEHASMQVPAALSVASHRWLHALTQALCTLTPATIPIAFQSHLTEFVCTTVVSEMGRALSSEPDCQQLVVQMLFDCRTLLQLLFATVNPQQSTSGRRLADFCSAELESRIDPFDLDVMRPALKQHSQRAALRAVALYGLLVPNDTAQTLARTAKTHSKTHGSSTEGAALLPVVGSDAPRLGLLPVPMPQLDHSQPPAPLLTNTDNLSSAAGVRSPLLSPSGGGAPGGVSPGSLAHQPLPKNMSAAAFSNFYDKIQSSWFGTSLLNRDGVLLAYSGFGESNVCVTAAIASSVWTTYDKLGVDSFHDDKLDAIFIECETGQVAITSIAGLLLCMCAKTDVPLGMLRAKLMAVASYLAEPLSQVSN